MSDLPGGYYAVLDPENAAAMTYWRVRSGAIKAWPADAWYGPARLLIRDRPADKAARNAWMRAWQTQRREWITAVHAALAADPGAARRRFARLTTRCCECGRELSDARSKVLGVGPDCRAGMDPAQLALLHTPVVAADHARQEAQHDA